LKPKPIRIAASILAADFTKLGEDIRRAEAGGADIIHVDVMDGRFVPNMTFGPPVIKGIRRVTRLPLDVHLMVDDPSWFVRELEGADVDMMSVHPESARHLGDLLRRIRGAGCRAGVALKPSTPLEAIECPLSELDFLLIMTVDPGFGGQPFLSSTLPKVRRAASALRSSQPNADLEVDGGISPLTAPRVVRAGANILVAGSAIYGANDVAGAIAKLRESARVSSG